MPLVPGTKVLLRRRGTLKSIPWFVSFPNGGRPCAMEEAGDGWRVHDAGDGTVLLESLTPARGNKNRFLGAKLDNSPPEVWLFAKNARVAVKWRPHPDGVDGFLLECVSPKTGPKWLAIDGSFNATLTVRPTGRSVMHEFIALPAADRQTFADAELKGDYLFLVPFGMTRTGRVQGIPKEVKPPKPAWAKGPRPTPKTPTKRANGDPVALELIAALQPSFDDGRGGAEYSVYEDEDDPRTIAWPHNVVSLATVATPTGTVHQFGEELTHKPPAGELAHCRTVAAAVSEALKNLEPFGGDRPTPFRPFYLVIGKDEKPPTKLTPEVVQAGFRGTLFPDTPIRVTPFTDERFKQDEPEWAGFIAWAKQQKELRELSYVVVGWDGSCEPNLAAVFPRLVLGLTKAGSLVGACGTIVQA